jgi:DNA-binding NtrC family response regulator
LNPSSSPHLLNVLAGRYTIHRKLGSGSLGTVYLANDARAGRPVALKVLRTDRLSAEAVGRFQREFGAIATLKHPQIAAAFDFGYTGEAQLPYYTREYIPGSPLPPGPPGRSSPREFLKPLLDFLDALEFLHDHGILHLDIHPGNLILSSDPARGAVLIDFGLFRSREGPNVAASSAMVAHFPPEVLRGDRLGPSTDLYLAGRVLLYRLLGEAATEPRLPREIPGWGPRLTLELERIAAKALEGDAGRRFQAAAEFREALGRALGSARRAPGPREASAVLVGRDAELRKLEEALASAAAGKTAALCLRGPYGIGKTRLLAQARVRAQFLGLEAVEVRFFPDAGPGSPLPLALARGQARPSWLEPLEAEHGGTPEERARRAARAYFEEDAAALALLLDDLDQADRPSRLLAEALLLEAAERRREGSPGRGLCLLISSTASLPAIRREETIALRPLRLESSRRLFLKLTRPLEIPGSLARRAAARAGGSPLRLQQLAQAVIREWGPAAAVPSGAELPDLSGDPISASLASLSGLEREGRELLEVLAVLGHAATAAEIAHLLRLAPAAVLGRLRQLERAELTASVGRGSSRLFQISGPGSGDELRREVSPVRARRIHRSMVRLLEARSGLGLREAENLARHLLFSGRREAGLRQALLAAGRLRRRGYHERAAALLEEAAVHEEGTRRKFSLLEELSSILEEIGDHGKGIRLLEPFHRKSLPLLPSAEATLLRRRRGVHYHRAGRGEEAARIFDEAVRLADPRRDVEDLIFIDSELAELHTLCGRLEEAETACRRGLSRLSSLRPSEPFRARMELVLRASRGHLELRRFNLAGARRDFREALRLSRRFRMPATRAVILNNLGLAENQLNRMAAARRAFREAEVLFLAAGEKRSLIMIACNLALIAGRLGEREEARLEIERAERLLRKVPGDRLEFSAAYARGVVAALLGDAETVLQVLPPALSLGLKLGDRHLVRYGEIYLAEARMACGRYQEAWRGLEALVRKAKGEDLPLLLRMAHSRQCLLAALLGRTQAGLEARSRLERIPRTPVVLLEAWNDLFDGLARLFAGEKAGQLVEAAGEVFRKLRVAVGERFSRLILMLEALWREDRRGVESELRLLRTLGPESHRFLAVARPLLLAEAHAFLGNRAEAPEGLSEASGAIIGSPFLELDWRIEFLRARLALESGDSQGARAHLHRALHTRDLLEELLPRSARRRFTSHPRFLKLAALADRLDRSPRLFSSSRRPVSMPFEGMVGRSPAMVQVFQAIERLRDQELPVLISGETGTGKELVARAIHRTSPRARGPFFALHAASLPVELFESELFGCEKGAFSGADEARAGLLESVSGGTLLLDEVSELALPAQAKLLRVLDQRRIRRLGGVEERPVDVRFLAATSADLRERVKAGAFRQDLFYRLAGMEIRLPPLRERKEDLALLARHFLELHARRLERPPPDLAPAAIRLLEDQPWPGNIRELEAMVLRALATLSPQGSLGAREIRPLLPEVPSPAAPRDSLRDLFSLELSLEEIKLRVEKAYLERLFLRLRGDPRRMMEVLGLKQSYYYSRLKDLGIDVRALREQLEE